MHLPVIDGLPKHRIRYMYKILHQARAKFPSRIMGCLISTWNAFNYRAENSSIRCILRKCGIEWAHKQVFVDSIHRSRGKNNEQEMTVLDFSL